MTVRQGERRVTCIVCAVFHGLAMGSSDTTSSISLGTTGTALLGLTGGGLNTSAG